MSQQNDILTPEGRKARRQLYTCGVLFVVLMLLAAVAVVFVIPRLVGKNQPQQPVVQQPVQQLPTQAVAKPAKTQASSVQPVVTQAAQQPLVTGNGAQVTNQVNVETNSGLPVYTVAYDTFNPYFIATILVKQMKFDQKYGIDLKMVPFYLPDGSNAFNEADRSANIQSGAWDGLLTTLDKPAKIPTIGKVTGVIEESDGLDAGISRAGINTFNDLKGKKGGYLNESIGQFFALFTLDTVQIPLSDITFVGYDVLTTDANGTVGAINDFNDGKLDFVYAWEPDSLAALPPEGQGHYLITSHIMRVPVDVMMTSNQAIANKPQDVLAYHKAWCLATKFALEDPNAAEALIIQWGKENNLTDWTYVGNTGDWVTGMAKSALATCADNAVLMAKVGQADDPLTARLLQYQGIWQRAGVLTGNLDANGFRQIIDPSFMLEVAKDPDLQTTAKPIDSSFSLTGNVQTPPLTAESAGQEIVLANLPFEKIAFRPNSVFLSQDGSAQLDKYVLPLLKASPYVYLKLTGSAAWPLGDTYNAEGVKTTAQGRVDQIKQYLVSHGISSDRISTSIVQPDPNKRCTTGPSCETSRFVLFELVTLGY
jgi:ABC-type nitrate/sulfonate/bicarbonate transport system substrate-binding protein